MQLIVAGMLAVAAFGATPKFEVASVKPCRLDNVRGVGRIGIPPRVSADRLILTCMPLWLMIKDAYQSYPEGRYRPTGFDEPVEGAPEWIRSALYTIEAKADGPATEAMMRGPMLRILLEERFHVKARRATREAAVYHLLVAKGGPKLKPFDGSCVSISDFTKPESEGPAKDARNCQNRGTATMRDWRGISLDSFVLAFLLPDIVGRPVINRTRIAGLYDIHLEFSFDADGDRPSIPAALEQQLGLRLVPARGPVEYLVLERVERPSAN